MSISCTGLAATAGGIGTEFPRPMGVPGYGATKPTAPSAPTETCDAPRPWTFDEDPDAGAPTQQTSSTGPNIYGGRLDINA